MRSGCLLRAGINDNGMRTAIDSERKVTGPFGWLVIGLFLSILFFTGCGDQGTGGKGTGQPSGDSGGNGTNGSSVLLSYLSNPAADSLAIFGFIDRANALKDSASIMSVKTAEKAVRYADSVGYDSALVCARIALGNMYASFSNLELAMKEYLEALSVAESKDYQKLIARIYNEIGNLYIDREEYQKALQYYQKALLINRKMNNEEWIGANYNNIGIVYRSTGGYEEAHRYFLMSMAICKKLNRLKCLANNYANIGMLAEKLDQPDSALHYYRLRMEIYRRLNYRFGIASTNHLIGRCMMKQGLADSAVRYLTLAFNQALKQGDLETQRDASRELASVYMDLKNYPEACRFQKILYLVNDSMSKISRSRTIIELELRYESERQNKMMMLESQQRTIRNTFAAVVLSLIIIIILLLYSRQRIKLRNAEIVKQNLELEKRTLARELEFKNRELATNILQQARRNEQVSTVVSNLRSKKTSADEPSIYVIDETLKVLDGTLEKHIWKDFEMRFSAVHSSFYDNLMHQFPDLTTNERRLCALLRLDMSTKEIAGITRQSVKAINVARTRLRKKLRIDNTETSLSNFLAQF